MAFVMQRLAQRSYFCNPGSGVPCSLIVRTKRFQVNSTILFLHVQDTARNATNTATTTAISIGVKI